MDVSSTLGLVAVVVLVLLNGFFVATEFSIVAVRRSRLEQLVQEGHPGAATARDVVGHLDSYIAATQLGITMASLALGWIGKPALATLIDPLLVALFGYTDSTAAHAVSAAIAFTVITMLHIVIGELMPKGLALQRPEGTTLWVAGPIKLFYAVFRWPINLLNAIGNGALKAFGLQPASGHEMVHSVEELRLLVTGMQQAGVVEASEARIAARAFAFGDRTAGGLMTPRTEMEAVPVTATIDQLLALAETTRHSRLPVYEGSNDKVLGVLHVRELFKYRNVAAETFDARVLVRPVPSVPESKHADSLLEEMRVRRCHIAMVVDEFGGTAGIVTLEDLVEALVGPVGEEPSVDGAPVVGAIETDGSVLLDGLTRLHEFEELVGRRLPEGVRDEVETVGGLVAAVLGRIPEVGEQATVVGRTLRVEARDGLRVAALRLLPA
jgi:CBS domain containing-hemolysin-like protein